MRRYEVLLYFFHNLFWSVRARGAGASKQSRCAARLLVPEHERQDQKTSTRDAQQGTLQRREGHEKDITTPPGWVEGTLESRLEGEWDLPWARAWDRGDK